MQSKPIISIICATYNRATLLPRAIDSVLAQDFQAWELLIIDDGSSDNTSDIVAKYTNDYRIKYLPLATNGGVGKARNYGIACALGEWVTTLDSDNALINNALEGMLKVVGEYSGYLVYKFAVVSFSGQLMSTALDSPMVISAEDYLNKKMPGENRTLVKKEIIQENKYLEAINGGEHITWTLVAFQVGKMLYHPLITEYYDNTGVDRLSLRSKNFERLYKVFLLDIKTLWKLYLTKARIRLLESVLKFTIYYILSLVYDAKKRSRQKRSLHD